MLLCVLPIEKVDEAGLAAVDRFARETLGFRTRRLEPLEMPPTARDDARGQHNATTILRAGLERCPPEATRLLVVTERDIFIPMLTFVFGQAQLDGRGAVLSLARLRQEFHGLPPRPDLFLARVAKEILHELGHTFGLTHCTDPGCAMSLSTRIVNIDRKRDELCRGCASRFADQLESLRREQGETRS